MLSKYKEDMNKFIMILAKPFMKFPPDLLTVIGLIFPMIFFYFMYKEQYLFALISFVGVAFDTLDGAVARSTGKVSKFGGVLDSTFDRVSDAIYLSAFYFGGLVRIELVLIVLVLSYMISYIRSRAELAAKGEFVLNVGIMERTERTLLLVLALGLEIVGYEWAEYVFVLLAVLCLVTVVQRLMVARERLMERN